MPIRSARRLLGRVALAVALALAGVSAHAQTLEATSPVPLFATRLDAETRVLPVWSNASGRIEALLLLDSGEPSFSANALDRVLNKPVSLGLGGRVQLDNGGQLRSTLQFDPDAGLALLCDGRVGLAGSLGALGEHCLLATLGSEDPLLAAAAQGAHLGFGWQSPNQRVDLSFGLSWLELNPTREAFLDPAGGLASQGLLASDLDAIGAWAQRLESRNLRMDSLINLGPQARMLLGGNLGRSRILGTDGTPLQWDTAALSVGMGFGEFSGQLTGRLIELPRSGNQWSSLDIGVSWRTPWRGELSLGAKNVLGSGDSSQWPLSELPAIEDPSARVPYVRYQQDL